MSSTDLDTKGNVQCNPSPVMGEGDSACGAAWLKEHWPNLRKLDHDWTMERYGYPIFVRNYIMNHWTKVSDKNGGTYAKPSWWREGKRKRKNKCF